MASSRKSNLAEDVAARLASLLPPRSTILIGLSGGMDSVVLLHLLHGLAPRYDWKLSALHVHHGISPNADVWADFCVEFCASLSISLHVERVDIAPLREHGIESAARKLRHAAFAKQNCDYVALAHHADDQAETLLLQLLRGSGVKGVAAMPLLGQRDGIVTVRPLLDVARAVLLDYARKHALRWVEDESNADDSYPRNFLRHRVLPLLEQRFPACRETLARSARHFAEAGELLDDLACMDAAQAVQCEALNIPALQALSPARAKNLLRHFLHLRGAPMPQTAQLEMMMRQLCDARQDAMPCVEFGSWQLRRYREQAFVMPTLPVLDTSLLLSWNGEAELSWSPLMAALQFERVVGHGISLKKLECGPVMLRLRTGGEVLRPHPRAATRSLKNLMQELDVPPWQRERLPLIYAGDELVCVVGVAVAAEYQAAAGEAGITVFQIDAAGLAKHNRPA